jgi:hypothetical protein
MREKVTAARVQLFMKTLGASVRSNARVYLVGGATAVLLGWRESTIDIDLKIIPDSDVLKSLPSLKEKLNLNVELAAPDDFIPALPNWETRSSFVQREGSLEFFHYDLYGQALAKLERGHGQDLNDVREMITRKLVEPERLMSLFDAIESDLYRYPAVDPASFRKSVEAFLRDQ